MRIIRVFVPIIRVSLITKLAISIKLLEFCCKLWVLAHGLILHFVQIVAIYLEHLLIVLNWICGGIYIVFCDLLYIYIVIVPVFIRIYESKLWLSVHIWLNRIIWVGYWIILRLHRIFSLNVSLSRNSLSFCIFKFFQNIF